MKAGVVQVCAAASITDYFRCSYPCHEYSRVLDRNNANLGDLALSCLLLTGGVRMLERLASHKRNKVCDESPIQARWRVSTPKMTPMADPTPQS